MRRQGFESLVESFGISTGMMRERKEEAHYLFESLVESFGISTSKENNMIDLARLVRKLSGKLRD